MTLVELTESSKLPKRLERFIQSAHLNFLIGSGASRPAIALAGNIEAEINELLESSKQEEADKKALCFIQELENQKNKLFENPKVNSAVNDTLAQYQTFLKSIDRILFERKNILLPRQANIFTTNYDEFIEVAASELPSITLNDGFNRRVGQANFKFAPELFFDRVYRSGKIYQQQSEIPSINLIKMHGSVSWRRKENQSIFFGREKHDPLNKDQQKDHDKVKDALLKRAVILPNIRKFESTLLDRTYFDLLRLYSNVLDFENALLFVFGFSFEDEHILDITLRALRNPTAMIVIFAFKEKEVDGFKEKFSERKNVLIVIPDSFEEIGFSEFNSIFAQIGKTIGAVDD